MTTTVRTTPATGLAELMARGGSPELAVPEYDRDALVPGVVHFGVGGFHRAHQAIYLDDLAARGETSWGVIGVGMHSPEMQQVLSAQDHLFTVVQRGCDDEHARIVGVVLDYLFAPQQPDAVLAALVDPRIRLVTLTVTGAGYPVDPSTGRFRADAEVAADLQHPRTPRSVFGFIVEALRLRRDAGTAPFTVLSSDNVAQNGRTTAAAVCGYARACDATLADWIEQHVAFPSSMVDRITPSTSPRDRDEIAERMGIDDGWPVITEPFSQWIIEDRFCNERPPLDEVGAQFVDDVRPYELMKTRLLNGGHCALGAFGLLLGHTSGDEAMEDELVREYVIALMDQVVPLLPPVRGTDPQRYRDQLITRFSNPGVADRLDRLARRGSTKLASYVVPSIVEARRRHSLAGLLTTTIAAWIELLTRPGGAGGPLHDPMRARLAPLAAAGDVQGILSLIPGFEAIADDRVVQDDIERSLRAMRRDGVRSAMRAAVDAA
jgi:fructuronate reductase/mannitol 2-dehydrogenase